MWGGRRDSLELQVIDFVLGGFRSREVTEADSPSARFMDEDELRLANWVRVVHREGVALAELAIVPGTRRELQATMPKVIDEARAWTQAEDRGEQMTPDLYVRGLCEAGAVHRVAIERVLAEQALDAEPIKAFLREAPPPSPDVPNPASLFTEVARVTEAHLRAIVGIARDLEALAVRK